MMFKRGQAALEFLMTYGWAFLVMIAVIAGIVALDPLGAAQTNINSCTLSAPLSCSSDALQLDASNNELIFEMENVGANSLEVSGLNITDTDTYTGCTYSPTQLAPGEVVEVTCSDVTQTQTDTSTVVGGDSYTLALDAKYYAASVGSEYARLAEGQIQTTAVN